MALLQVRNLSLSFGGPLLLENAAFSIEKGERICLLGRNGEGKSSLLKILTGELEANSGEITREKGLVVSRLIQEVPIKLVGSVFEIVTAKAGAKGELIRRYHHVSDALETNYSDATLQELEDLHRELDSADAWNFNQLAESVISRLNLDKNTPFESLSGGRKRRVLLAQALVHEPDILILDEPTNHLDIESILWLEEFLIQYGKTLFFVSHDRAFIKRLATRILELDRGKVRNWDCTWNQYIERRDEVLRAEEIENALFDKKLAQEETWIRQGIKARRTRNEGRVRALKKLRTEREQRREQIGSVKLQAVDAGKSGRLVFKCSELSFSYDKEPLVKDLNTSIMRGDRIGIVGPNGSGKTTLIRLLLGDLKPISGSVQQGTNLEPAYFDQLRAQIQDDKTLFENIGAGKEYVTINGQNRHVYSYLQDFLFTPERARSPVHVLSGGERNRLLLARLFSRPSNLLILDEPTNDLDTDTLDLLEELLSSYPGTVLMVSHDRAFIDNVVTALLILEPGGSVREFSGSYEDYMRFKTEKPKTPPTKNEDKKLSTAPQKKNNEKLSYKDQKELDELPGKIEQMENRLEEIHKQMSDPEVFTDHLKLKELQKDLELKESELEKAYTRWETLSGNKN
jgi:ATP-binding cassette subfamily F protein uup